MTAMSRIRIEGTELAQQAFDRIVPAVDGSDPSPYEKSDMAKTIVQQFLNDPECPQDNNGREDYIRGRVNELHEQNGLPYPLQAFDVFYTYIRGRHER